MIAAPKLQSLGNLCCWLYINKPPAVFCN